MRFSLRWLFLVTMYVGILLAGVSLSQTWPPGLMLMIMVAILVSLFRPWRPRQSPEAAAYYRDHPELPQKPLPD